MQMLRININMPVAESMHNLSLHASHQNFDLADASQADAQRFLWPVQAQTQVENWIGVLQEVALPGTDADVDAFLPAAVDFCNKECWGSLSASIFIHPTVQRAHSQAVEDAISSLQYGAVTVNCPSFVAYAIPYLAWGAYPGNQPHVSTSCATSQCCNLQACTGWSLLDQSYAFLHLIPYWTQWRWCSSRLPAAYAYIHSSSIWA